MHHGICMFATEYAIRIDERFADTFQIFDCTDCKSSLVLPVENRSRFDPSAEKFEELFLAALEVRRDWHHRSATLTNR